MDHQQARFWNMRVSNNSSLKYNFVLSNESGEQKAFAEDAARRSGAFVWLPRSYNCNFCGREFKSAQALGGHMNAHRRDRARLKQSPIKSLNHHNYIQDPTAESKILGEYPNQVCSMVYDPNIVNHISGELPASYFSPITAPTASFTQKSTYDQSSVVFSTSQDQQKRPYYSSSPPSRSDFTSDIRLFSIIDSKIEEAFTKKQKSRTFEADIIKYDHLPTVSLNLQEIGSKIEETTSCKGRRTDDVSLPFFMKAATRDNLDLELRLGDQPKL